MIGEGLGVFHPEAFEEDFGVVIRDVVAVAIGIEEEIGDLQDEQAAVAEFEASAEIQTGNDVFLAIHVAVAIGVLKDGNDVGACWSPGRRLVNLVLEFV
jgi:hypothetical protein